MPESKRTKGGCITCKIRKVKCDEGKPHCRRCTSTNRRCDGYSTLPYSRDELLATSSRLRSRSNSPKAAYIDDRTFPDIWEKRCFEFFRHRTVVSTNALINARFWDRVVLQAAHVEPAIKHGVLALSSFHQLTTMTGDSFVEQRDHADRQYQLCLKHAQDLLARASESEIDRVLIVCIICVHFESVRGHFQASKQHMNNGRAIIRQYSTKFRQANRKSDLAEIQQAFARLEVSYGSCTDKSTPYDLTMDSFYDTAPLLAPWEFASVSEARNCLFDLFRWLLLVLHHLCFAHSAGDVERFMAYGAVKQECKSRLEEWKHHFEAIASRTSASEEPTVLMLRLWYLGEFLLMEKDISEPEQQYDAYLADFERLVSLGEQIAEFLSQSEHKHFSYDLGYTHIMFFAAHHCRDPVLRRRALKVLRAMPRREGSFVSGPGADVVEHLIQLEEGGLPIATAEDIAEERRVWYVEWKLDFPKGIIEVEFHRSLHPTPESRLDVLHLPWALSGVPYCNERPL